MHRYMTATGSKVGTMMVHITGNTIITALYEPIPNTVTFKDGVTNEDILTISVLEGTIITEFPNAPEHDG